MLNLKKHSFLFLFFCFSFNISQAQESVYVINFEFAFADTSYKAFLTENRITHMEVKYENKPIELTLFFMDSISSRTISNRYEKKEYYNLNFEGDQYLLSKWYPKLKKPTPIRIEKSQIHTLPKCENDWTTCQSFISKDSIRYLFHQQCYSNKNVIFKRVQTFARYKGKTQELEKALEEKYNKYRGVSLTDSACLFRSFSQVDGTLKKIQLLAGEKNKFSDFIKKEIEILSISKGWIPRIVSSGRQVKSYLKIYARLNKDKSITFSTSDGY